MRQYFLNLSRTHLKKPFAAKLKKVFIYKNQKLKNCIQCSRILKSLHYLFLYKSEFLLLNNNSARYLPPPPSHAHIM